MRLFARQFSRPANGLAGLTRPLFRRLFISAAAFHFAEKTFALQFLFQDPQGLIDIVVSNENFQGISPSREKLLDMGAIAQGETGPVDGAPGLEHVGLGVRPS